MLRFQTLATVLMATLAFTAVGCAGTAGGSEENGSTTASEIHAGKSVTHAEFESAIKAEDNWLPTADGCTFSMKSKAGGLELSLKADGGTVTLDVDSRSAITLSEKDGDGSDQTYTIAGVGSVRIIHADDAFVSFALTSSKTKVTSTCEIDF
jgi:hypothetical protein